MDDFTKPLANEGIDAAELQAWRNDGTALAQRIEAEDRPHFVADAALSTAYEERELIVTLDAYTKHTNRGYLYLQNGKRVPYMYVGEDATALCAMFGTYDGFVKIRCKATMRGQEGIVHVEIYEYWRMQNFLTEGKPTADL